MAAACTARCAPGGRLVAYVTHRETMEHWAFARAGLHRLFDAAGLAAALLDRRVCARAHFRARVRRCAGSKRTDRSCAVR